MLCTRCAMLLGYSAMYVCCQARQVRILTVNSLQQSIPGWLILTCLAYGWHLDFDLQWSAVHLTRVLCPRGEQCQMDSSDDHSRRKHYHQPLLHTTYTHTNTHTCTYDLCLHNVLHTVWLVTNFGLCFLGASKRNILIFVHQCNNRSTLFRKEYSFSRKGRQGIHQKTT